MQKPIINILKESDLFDNWAKKYEANIVKLKDCYPFAGYLEIISFIQKYAHKNDCLSILDLGVGSGFLLEKIVTNKPMTHYGLDFSSEMIKIAMEKFDSSNLLLYDISLDKIPETIKQINSI